jgi:hypothetical protein
VDLDKLSRNPRFPSFIEAMISLLLSSRSQIGLESTQSSNSERSEKLTNTEVGKRKKLRIFRLDKVSVLPL